MKFETRRSGWHPSNGGKWSNQRSFSVAVGPAPETGRRPAAWYRVQGAPADHPQVDALAARLVAWLDEHANKPGGDRCPAEIPFVNDKSARIVRTKAGRKAGFYGPFGPTRADA